MLHLLSAILPVVEPQLKALLVQFLVENAPKLVDEVFNAIATHGQPKP